MKKVFIGISYLTLDKKGRVFLPQKFRLKKKYVLTYGIDNCIVIYPYQEWFETVKKIDSISLKNKLHQRIFNRTFFAQAEIVELDNQGRLLIPKKFKDKYSLSDEVVLVGNRNKIELWSKNEWEKYYKNVEKILAQLKSQIEI
jgi:MraZ protein